MKAYVIVTLNLCAMHGANMFIYNKVQYLKNHGWKVFVFSAEQGEILIPGLREYQNDQISTIRFYPACFSQKQIGRVLDQIEQRVREAGCDEVMVESTNLISALWGELIAQRLGGKNMAYILQERFGVTSEMKKFLRFKLSRHELAGIAKESVSKMLGDPELPFDDSMHIVAYCTNSIDICEDTVTPQLNPDADLTFGSIGRLEKLFVHPMIQQLQAYFLQHSDQTFNLVMLGGTRAQKCYQQIRDAMEPCKNVTLVFTGYIFPIPKSFVDRCDLFLSAAGSAIATYHMRRPTIEMNPTTGDIIGALGDRPSGCRGNRILRCLPAPVLLREGGGQLHRPGAGEEGCISIHQCGVRRRIPGVDVCGA